MSGIRIIAGEGRGKAIKIFEGDLSTRPILCRIKKSLFDILTPKIVGAKFLDLYAGTGAVGIEAISRGADCAEFVESNRRYITLIKENLNALGWEGRAKVHEADIMMGLTWLREQFDLIFVGPPYKDKNKKPLTLTSKTLKLISEQNLLAVDGWVISQHHKKEPITVPENHNMFRQKVYGDTFISFYEKK